MGEKENGARGTSAVVRRAVVPPGGAALSESNFGPIDQMSGSFDGHRVFPRVSDGTSC